jgi:hypothetical protein
MAALVYSGASAPRTRAAPITTARRTSQYSWKTRIEDPLGTIQGTSDTRGQLFGRGGARYWQLSKIQVSQVQTVSSQLQFSPR